MPLPPKAEKQTREQVYSKLPADVLAKYLRDEEERKRRERNETAKRLEDAWWEKKQREQFSREQPSKNQELMAASLTLGIPINSSMHDIKKAYHRLAMQTHPDKHPNDPNANAKFQAIESAYQKLSSMPKKGGNKCRNRRTHHVPKKKTQTHRHTTHHRKTHRVRV
jgi:hypothetical protein